MHKSIKLNWTLFRLWNKNHLEDAFNQLCSEVGPLIESSNYFPQIGDSSITFLSLYVRDTRSVSLFFNKMKEKIQAVIENGCFVCFLSNRDISLNMPKYLDSTKCLFLCGQRLLRFIE